MKIRLSTDGAAEVNKLGDRIDKAFKPQLVATEAAFRQLGLGGSRAFQDLERAAKADKIQAAFKTIQTSAFATGAEVDRAAKNMQSQLAALNSGAGASGAGFGKLQAAATQATGALAQAGVSTGLLGTAIGALTSPIGLVAIGVGALGLAIKTTTDFMLKNHEQMRGLMAVSGQTADETDQLADTFDLLGFNVDALRTALFKMAAEVDSGGKGLRELGVNLRDVSGEMKAEGAIFLEVRDRISEMGSASERNAAALKFFGRSAREMAAVFQLSTEEFGKWLEKAGLMGPSAAESMRVTEEYRRSLALFNKEWQGLVEIVGQAVLPVLTGLLNVMTRIREIRIGETTSEWDEFLTGVGAKAKAAKEELEGLSRVDVGLGATPKRTDLALTKAEVEDIKLNLKEIEADKLRSISVVEARSQAARKLEQTSEAQAAQKSIGFAQQRATAKIAAIDGEIAAIKRTSTAEIKEGTEAHDKIRALMVQRADAHSQMAVTVIGLESSIGAAAVKAAEAWRTALGGIAGTLPGLASAGNVLLPTDDAAEMLQPFLKAVEQARAALVALKDSFPAAEFAQRLAVFDAGAESLTRWAKGMADGAVAAKAAKAEAEAFYKNLAENVDAARLSVEAMEFSYEKWLATLNAGGERDEAKDFYKNLAENIDAAAKSYESIQTPIDDAARASLAFQESLAAIDRQVLLLGTDVDPLPLKISAITAEILRLGTESNGVVTPAIAALQAQLAGLKQVQELKGIFADVFSSIGSAIHTSIQGAIMGTQTMAQAWNNLWKSIVASFLNSGIQRLLKGLSDWAGDFLAALFGGGGGGRASSGGGIIGGLFTAGSAVGASGGIGTSDITRPTGGGFNSAGFTPGEAGGSPFSGATSTLGAFTTGLQAATSGTSTFSSVLSGVTTGWQAGSGVIGGASSAISGGYQALSTALAGASTLTVALSGVGAAVAAFGSIMDVVNGKLEAGIGGMVGGLALGAVGAYFAGPIGAFIGYALGDVLGSWIGGLFGGGPSNFELKRIKAADDAAALVGGVGTSFATAARTGSAADTLAALIAGQAPAGSTPNPLRTDLALPPALAEQLGLASKAEIENGKAIVHWADVTAAQFDELIALFKADPSMIASSIIGKGDVSYLTPEKVREYTDALQQGAVALLSAFTAFESVRDQITGFADDIVETASALMPADLAGQLADYIVNPIRDEMLAKLQEPNLSVAEMEKQLDAMSQTLQSKVQDWGKFADALGAIDVVGALIPADLADQMHAAVQPGYDQVINAMRTGTAQQATLAVANFEKQAQAWAAFGQAVEQSVNVEALLESVPTDLGDRYAAAMAPIYDKVLASLVAGNGAIALAQAQQYARLTAVWGTLGPATTQALDVEALLPADLGERFHAAMQPIYDKILASLVAGNATIAQAQIETFNRLTAVWATLGKTTTAAIDVDALLPEDLGDSFRARMQPEYDKIMAALVAGNAAVAATLLDTFNKQLAAWASIGQTVTRITGELAGLTGDFEGSIEAWRAVQQQMDGAVDRAQAAFGKALASGDVERIAATAATLHDATIARYQAEREAVERLLAVEQQLVARMGELADTMTGVAVAMLAFGDATRVNALLASLADLAASAAPASVRLMAVGAGIRAIIAALPEAVKGVGSMAPDAAVGVFAQIPATVASSAMPFLSSLDGLIADALTAGDTQGALDLLKEQAGAIQALGAAAVSAVEQWRDQTIAAYEQIAAEMITAIETQRDADIKTIETLRDAELAANDAKIAAIEKTRDAELAANEAQLSAVQAQLQLAQQWLSAVQGAESFVEGLLLGPGSPLNPAEQLTLVKSQYEAAKAAALSSPEGLSSAISAAQTYLGFLGRGGQESTGLKGVTADVLKDVRGFLASTGSSAGWQAQIGGLQAQAATLTDTNKTIREVAEVQIGKLHDINESIRTKADEAIAEVKRLSDEKIDGIKTKLAEAITAIEKAAADTIKEITLGVAAALDINTGRQIALLTDLFNSNQDQLKAITGGLPVQYYLAQQAAATVAALGDINRQLVAFASATPAPAPPSAPERVGSFATGTPFVPRTGWAYVHRGERITPAGQSSGREVLVIEELRVPVVIDGQQVSETVVKHVTVRVKAGGRDFIPAGAVAKR